MLGYALEVFGLFGRKTHRAIGLVGFAIDGREDHVGREVAARQRGVKTILRIEHAVGTFGTPAAPRCLLYTSRSDVQVFVRCDGIPDEVTGGKTEE